jgi:hypothetical protein
MSLSQFFHRSRHFCSIMIFMLGYEDFSVVVKNRAKPPKPWRWEVTGPVEPVESNIRRIILRRSGKLIGPAIFDFKKGASNISSTAAVRQRSPCAPR